MKSMIIGAALLIGSTNAFAHPIIVEAAPSERVTYADLNLASAAGKAMLQGRIRAAAGRVCDLGGTPTLEEFGTESRCYRTAVDSGFRQMDIVVARIQSGAPLAAALVVTAK